MTARKWTFLAFGSGAAVASGVVAVSLVVPSSPPAIWPDLLKAGVQVGVVALVGAAVTWLLARAEAQRETDRRIEQYRLRILRDIVEAYNHVKGVRRMCRGLGFVEPRGHGLLTDEQASALVEQMRTLSNCQLVLERIKRELEAAPGSLPKEDYVLRRVSTVEQYVHTLVAQWEDHGWALVAGSPIARIYSLDRLQAFAGDKSKHEEFERKAARPMRQIQSELHRELNGQPPRGTVSLPPARRPSGDVRIRLRRKSQSDRRQEEPRGR